MYYKINKLVLICTVLIAGMFITSCKKDDKTVIIAEQYGLAYAPLQLMQTRGYLDEALGDEYKVEWVKLANTVAIREAMLGDDLDVGFMGIPPFLIGVDNEMPWKIMTGLSQSPLGLVTNGSEISNLEELIDAGKIALPQLGSIQHILLSMAAENQIGHAKIFDQQIVSMKHPDGYMALLSGTEIKAHFTSPPYLFQELDQENTSLILSGDEAMGGSFTFIVGVCREAFYDNEYVYNAFIEALDKAIDDINKQDESVVKELALIYDLDEVTVYDYLYKRGMKYEEAVIGVQKFIDFMAEETYISEGFEENEVIWEAR